MAHTVKVMSISAFTSGVICFIMSSLLFIKEQSKLTWFSDNHEQLFLLSTILNMIYSFLT